MTDRHVVTIQVTGRPATFATAHEKPWKDAVRLAVVESGVEPQVARFAIRLEFRLATARNANEVWDLDNLIKPTLDAMEGIFGTRAWRGAPQPADDRVERISAVKRLAGAGELPGATIDVWVIEPD
ncbi:RusA family crossover junction endodeoxyribonuclease [Nonomuraea sp. C10]|uniref:RusA family crossover junction endodeoxyribonuclease n=1 Tax=Nonomuraea sp. C10 TaxID=2600577 RepID=UPI0011CD5D7F|nr:RusA family crossover junction endodeoxyribonuclease [Nonomuraea sp. C10]TXK35119.1 RusA family crossover junction endodeoxyribonuclease [Nonomuraea sp. C10]